MIADLHIFASIENDKRMKRLRNSLYRDACLPKVRTRLFFLVFCRLCERPRTPANVYGIVGPLAIELAGKTPILTSYLPIRISQLPLKLPPFTPQEIRGENSQYLAS
jgi:hypothetical protein